MKKQWVTQIVPGNDHRNLFEQLSYPAIRIHCGFVKTVEGKSAVMIKKNPVRPVLGNNRGVVEIVEQVSR